ncbi:arsenate reductase family protein [Dysgonomonas sp. 216]|uniref:arsenate reductase family protein n=1 Tax=Dysgonomonas sp. 216 TaxID=2302934 RepID=UPI0013D11484|nr:arsenate reductase family protein [Dysgonomonas sp. 216]NDW18197.1 arsenate reductase family protein [Dysgonomonas sp. 216]
MENILFLQYPKCGTCQKAAKWLSNNNVNVVVRDITTKNPTVAELTDWITRSGKPINKFFNTSGRIYKEQNLKDVVKTASPEELIKLLSTNGMLVKRPIVVSDKFVLVGFDESEWAESLSQSRF